MAITSLIFRIVPIKGQIGAATQANPSGFVGKSWYYEILQNAVATADNQNVVTGPQGRCVGIIAYDYFQSRWAVLFTQDGALAPNDPTAYVNNVQAITDFLTAIQNAPYPQPMTTDAIGDLLPYPASLPPIKS